MLALNEANKTSGRIGTFTAVSVVATYFISQRFPGLPVEVVGGIVVLITAGLAWADRFLHKIGSRIKFPF